MNGVRDQNLAGGPTNRHVVRGRDAPTGEGHRETNLSPFNGNGRQGSLYIDITFRDVQANPVHIQTVDAGSVH